MVPSCAAMEVVPGASVLAKPWEFDALLIAATFVWLELHVTCAVRFCVEWSVKVPVATNCWLSPLAILGFDGVIAMETSAAALTVTAVLPETAPRAAEIVA